MNSASRSSAEIHRRFESAGLPDPSGSRFYEITRRLFTFYLFCLGALIWVCQPKQQMGAPLVIPLGPPQVLLTMTAAITIVVFLWQGRGRFPVFFQPTISTLFQITGLAMVCLGALLHLQPGPRLIDTLLYLDRWMLPFFAALLFCLASQLRVSYTPLIYGLFVGLIVTVISVEAAHRGGVPLPVGNFTEGRYSGFLNHPNQYGIVLSTTAPFLLVPLLNRRWLVKAFGVFMVGIYLIGLYQNLSKTNFALFPLALVVSFLLVSVGTPRSFIRALGIVSVLCVFMLGVAFAAFRILQDYSPRDAAVIENSLLDPRNASTVEDREDVWAEVQQAIKHRPFSGYGPGWSEDNISVTHAHNLYLQAWLDAGILGVAGACVVTLAALFRLCGVFLEILRSGKPEPANLLPALASVAMVFSLLGNSMSSSLHTATFVPYAIAVALSLLHPALFETPFTLRPLPRQRPAHRRTGKLAMTAALT